MSEFKKVRLDKYLVENHLVKTRSHAVALIKAKKVLVNGKCIENPATKFLIDTQQSSNALEVKIEDAHYVSRGAIKLKDALNDFDLNQWVSDKTCLDVGASTGGFTQCLLDLNAKAVFCVDVGTNQLNAVIASDPRVDFQEGINVKNPFQIKEKVDLIVMDLSFISVTKVLKECLKHLKNDGKLVVLFKPQFEVYDLLQIRTHVVDENIGLMAIEKFKDFLEKNFDDIEVKNQKECSIKGKTGNQEYFLELDYSQKNKKESEI